MSEADRLRAENAALRDDKIAMQRKLNVTAERAAADRRALDEQRARAEAAERRCWAVRPGSGPGDIECCLRRGHDGDHWATTGCAGSEISWPRLERALDEAQAKVAAVEQVCDDAAEYSGYNRYDIPSWVERIRAALAAAQPTESAPARPPASTESDRNPVASVPGCGKRQASNEGDI